MKYKVIKKRELVKDTPVILTGVRPKPKKNYADYKYLFMNANDFGNWKGKRK